MAARLYCELDPSRDVLLLRPFGAQPGGRPVSRFPGDSNGSTASTVPPVHRQDFALRRLPACAYSNAGPCVLRFTCAEAAVNMETTMTNFVTWHTARQRGTVTQTLNSWQWYFGQLLMNQWEETGWDDRIIAYVLGGCRHKLR
ncbi:X protein [Pomona bat hepatitis B virus]|uniref:Protein X n=1 Tax=Pomona bat hepatitis B virus TaxID=2049933 RepID=A0A0A7DPL2_9HEPA|nr:X protein [Pomona bat hepatitis B virus]AIW47285.1 X protein [Bat hepatitis virus]AIW47289.1 X protein [Pomona bat hepatitis B virus]AIW47293.1 X protein [Bat hepatitis virus]